MGTWIEIFLTLLIFPCCIVVPLVGTWIEIKTASSWFKSLLVVPLVGTWIEIQLLQHCTYHQRSFPLWERGLKYFRLFPCCQIQLVVPLVGTWIEIY